MSVAATPTGSPGRLRGRGKMVAGVALAVIVATVAVMIAFAPFENDPASAGQGSFTGGAVSIPVYGNGSPYPSTANVSGLTGKVTKVAVTLNSLSHTCPSDIDAMLVAPNGTTKTLLITNAGGCSAIGAVNVSFDDGAQNSVPTPITSGTFKPTASGPWSAASPAATSTASLATFNDLSPNGTWSLYIYDDAPDDSGSLGSWRLDITTGTAPVNTDPPHVTGVARVGQTLHVDNGTWTADPAPNFSYQWTRCNPALCAPISIAGATNADYTLTDADLGRTIWAVVTATNAAGHTPIGSHSVGPVQPAGGGGGIGIGESTDPCDIDPESEACLEEMREGRGRRGSGGSGGSGKGSSAIGITSTSLRLSKGRVAVKVSCADAASCSKGKVVIKTATKVRTSAKKIVTLGKRSFTKIAAGQTATVKVKLSKKNQSLVKRLGKVKVKVSVSATVDRSTVNTTQTLKLKAK